MTQPTEEGIRILIARLRGRNAKDRLEAVEAIGELQSYDESVLKALELTAANDRKSEVRDSAFIALQNLSRISDRPTAKEVLPHDRGVILAALKRWEAEGLLPSQVARVLRNRYEFRPSSKRAARAKAAPDDRRNLSQLLLSETSVKIALYLGAFFILAASFILAAIVEAARLPIISAVTIGAIITAWFLYRRIPMASFTLSLIGTLLIPIDAAVILDLYASPEFHMDPYWMGVAALLGVIWIAGTWLYESRLFSLLALMAFMLTGVFFSSWIGASFHTTLFVLAIASLLGLVLSIQIRRTFDKSTHKLLFIVVHIALPGLLVLSSLDLIFKWGNFGAFKDVAWLSVGCTWLTVMLAYLWSNRTTPSVLFRAMAAICLIPIPLFFLQEASPSLQTVVNAAWIWGGLLALASHFLSRTKFPDIETFSPTIQIASSLPFAYAGILALELGPTMNFGFVLATAVVYLLLSLWKARSIDWALGLTFALWAYFSVFSIPSIEARAFYSGYKLLPPFLTMLLIDLAVRRIKKGRKEWFLPPQLFAFLLGFIFSVINTVYGLADATQEAAVAYLIMGVGLGAYALLYPQPQLGYLATASSSLALVFFVIYRQPTDWLWIFLGLSLVYYLVGLSLKTIFKVEAWDKVLRVSGLVFGAITAISALFDGGQPSVVIIALVATMYAFEAFRQRNVWLGFPANAFYLAAYFLALHELEVIEPQFYSIGAALLGIIMHYLLVRGDNLKAAFITGLVSQLILLSTTYVQMVSSDKLSFFFILFFQSLVMIIYGLVVRARSFIIVPIIFVLLSVITVAFSVLSGIPTAIIIGCTGFILLLLGILSLALRKQLLDATDRLGQKLGGWRA